MQAPVAIARSFVARLLHRRKSTVVLAVAVELEIAASVPEVIAPGKWHRAELAVVMGFAVSTAVAVYPVCPVSAAAAVA